MLKKASKVRTRRPHRKTRTGCAPCKKRRVKCDESKPSCENCLKYELSCEYALPKSPVTGEGAPAGPLTPSKGLKNLYATPTTTTSSINLTAPPVLNVQDLELMHQFCTSTCHTLHRDPTIATLWAINVPPLGFSNDFVMHGILALAALHLAHCRPEKRDYYLPLAVNHHREGLTKATPVLPQLSTENCSAIYIFSGLTLIYTKATSQSKDDSILVGEAGIAEWIVLSRQTYSIIKFSQETLWSGPLGPMFRAGERRGNLQSQLAADGFGFPEADRLHKLSSLIMQAVPGPPWKRTAYLGAIDELLRVFRVVASQPRETLESTDLYIWAYRISDDFLTLLREQTQEALVIMAFYAVLPQRLDLRRCWWLENFSIHLISKIYPLLDETHLEWIQWPLEEIGWRPEGIQDMLIDPALRMGGVWTGGLP